MSYQGVFLGLRAFLRRNLPQIHKNLRNLEPWYYYVICEIAEKIVNEEKYRYSDKSQVFRAFVASIALETARWQSKSVSQQHNCPQGAAIYMPNMVHFMHISNP